LRNDSPAINRPQSPSVATNLQPSINNFQPTGNGHRIVLGKGARKQFEARPAGRFQTRTPGRYDSPPPAGKFPERPSTVGARIEPRHATHVAGARMDVFRKENRPMKRGRPAPTRMTAVANAKDGDVIPPLAADSIRIIPLGGVEEIGRNMTAIEFGDDIIIIDMGFQFRDENTPGIDYILPNTKYLEERQRKIRATIITHGHLHTSFDFSAHPEASGGVSASAQAQHDSGRTESDRHHR
jgi:hypothetical protein